MAVSPKRIKPRKSPQTKVAKISQKPEGDRNRKRAQIGPIKLPDGGVIIDGCLGKRECIGCNPIGRILRVDPHKIREVKTVDSMNFCECELDGVWLTEKIIQGVLYPFSQSEKKYFWSRGIRSDLDNITVYEVYGADTW